MKIAPAYPNATRMGRIRTPGGVSPTVVFKTTALDHSATHPDMFGNSNKTGWEKRAVPVLLRGRAQKGDSPRRFC